MSMVLLALLTIQSVAAQSVVVNESPAVTELMEKYKSQSGEQNSISGWRIQIITTDDRRKMETARAKFETMYPGLYLKWEHVVPYYKIKVGAYKEKIDLQGFLQELRQDFPAAIPIPEKIKKTELVY